MEGVTRDFDAEHRRDVYSVKYRKEPPYDLKRSYLASVELFGRGHMWALPKLPNRAHWQMSGGKRIG